MKHHVLYVPGLTDKAWHIRGGQRAALKLWRLNGVTAEYFVADWANKDESHSAKLARLIKLIDSYTKRGHTVSLVSVSAGSTLALSAFVKRKKAVHAFVSICGMIKHPKAVDAAVFAFNPAFEPSMLAAAEDEGELTEVDRKKILIVRAARDSYVPNRHGHIQGAHTTTIPTMGHVASIVLAITMYRRRIIDFIKQK